MTETQLKSSDITFRRVVINLLHQLKSYSEQGDYETILTTLQEKLEQVPTNDYEQSTKFFEETACSIISILEEFYDISLEKITTEECQSDKFTLRIKEDVKEHKETFQKYRGMERFVNGFLQEHNRELWYQLRRMSSNSPLENRYIQDENGHTVIQLNKVAKDQSLFLPSKEHGGYVGVSTWDRDYFSIIYDTVSQERNYLKNINEVSSELTSAVDIYNIQLSESLREEHLRFGIAILKKLLSRIIVPVSLIEDEALRTACEESGRKVFVRRPTMEDLMPFGCSVHVYASHDLDDDSSYIAKPILITEELPKDTDELKYLGVGQYTHYDDTSERSLNGANPFIINHNVYVKAIQKDFERLIPEELLEEITLCEELLRSNTKNDDVLKISNKSYISDLITEIESDESLNPKDIINRFFDNQTKLEEQAMQEEPSTGESHTTEYRFRPVMRSLNLHPSFQYEFGILIVDPNEKYGALRKRSSGEYDLFTSYDCNECIKALGWSNGTYSVYDMTKLNQPRNIALKKFFVGGL